jgi:type IV pilus assembly protein PilX
MKTSIMFTTNSSPLGKKSSQGISLIVVLIMLVIIGITAGTAMRTATSEQRATNNLRMEATAQQYAEAALRYCENQISTVPDGNRPAGLQSANMPLTTPTPPNTSPPTSAWETVANWAAGSAILVIVPADRITDANTVGVTNRPQCIAEQQTVGASIYRAIVITARGFSPDYVADANGNTTQGAVVWLQSVINAN